MRNLQILKSVTLLLLWLLVINSLGSILVIILFAAGAKDISIINGVSFENEIGDLMFALFKLLGHSIFIYGVIRLKNVVDKLSKLQIFDDNVIRNLYIAGNSFIISGLLIQLIDFVYRFAKTPNYFFDMNRNFVPVLFVIVIGIFLKIMAVVLRIAQSYKEENELTI